ELRHSCVDHVGEAVTQCALRRVERTGRLEQGLQFEQPRVPLSARAPLCRPEVDIEFGHVAYRGDHRSEQPRSKPLGKRPDSTHHCAPICSVSENPAYTLPEAPAGLEIELW